MKHRKGYMNKNKELLKSFTEYCDSHKELRFWQALRNWADIDYLLAKTDDKTEDTFYWTDKDG